MSWTLFRWVVRRSTLFACVAFSLGVMKWEIGEEGTKEALMQGLVNNNARGDLILFACSC